MSWTPWKKTALAAYLLALHALLAFAVLRTDLVPRLQVKFGLTDHMALWQVAVDATHVSDHFVKPGAVLFLGDSITRGLEASAVADQAVNYGVNGQRSDELLTAMEGYRSLQMASGVVVSIGINDLAQRREAGIGERYAEILRRIPADVPVVFSSVTYAQSIPLEMLERTRDAAALACSQRANCLFVDAVSPLKAGGGDNFVDGVHLSAAGYKVWIGQLREAAARLRHAPSTGPRLNGRATASCAAEPR